MESHGRLGEIIPIAFTIGTTLAAFFLHGFFFAHFLMLLVILFIHLLKLFHALVDDFFFFSYCFVHDYFFPFFLGIFAPDSRATFKAIATAWLFFLPAFSSFLIFSPMAFFEALFINGILSRLRWCCGFCRSYRHFFIFMAL